MPARARRAGAARAAEPHGLHERARAHERHRALARRHHPPLLQGRRYQGAPARRPRSCRRRRSPWFVSAPAQLSLVYHLHENGHQNGAAGWLSQTRQGVTGSSEQALQRHGPSAPRRGSCYRALAQCPRAPGSRAARQAPCTSAPAAETPGRGGAARRAGAGAAAREHGARAAAGHAGAAARVLRSGAPRPSGAPGLAGRSSGRRARALRPSRAAGSQGWRGAGGAAVVRCAWLARTLQHCPDQAQGWLRDAPSAAHCSNRIVV